MAQCLDLLRVAGERVETRGETAHAVDEEAQVDPWAPRDGVPRHRSTVSGGHETSEHPEERRRGYRRGRVHAHRASAPQDHFVRGERTGPNGRLEEFFLRREPRELVV